jgi:hypothetical protein
MTALDLLIRHLEGALFAARAIQAQDARIPPPLPAAPAVDQPERRTDLIGKEWIEAGVAASRFEISKGRIQAWCQRDDDFGWKRGGRWYVSITKMRARLGIK